jgi:outer membrane immunogenic protein
MFRKLSLGIVGATMFALSASAGGLKDIPAPEDPGWRGFYVGGYAGYGVGDSGTHAAIDPALGFSTAYNGSMSPGLHPSELEAGGQVGYNFQSGRWVLGVEGSFGSFGLNDTVRGSATVGANALGSATKVDADWLGTVRGRLGWGNKFGLIYGTGGAAFTSLNYSQQNVWLNATFPNPVTFTENASKSDTRSGWTAGGGIEYKLGSNWSGKLEYLHVDFGTIHGSGAIYDTATVPALKANVSHSAGLRAEVVNVGLNYHFQPSYEPLK